MRAPDFWHRSPNALDWRARLLMPLGALYAALTAYRVRQPARYIALAQMLLDMGQSPHIVSLGYGGKRLGPHLVSSNDAASDVGDEPLLLSAFAKTWIAKDRALGIKAACDAGASHILMDDGFQNPSVEKSLSIVVVDAQKGFGNGLCLPAGPLREPVHVGLKRADFVLSIGGDAQQKQFEASTQLNIPRLRGHLEPLQTGLDFDKIRCIAFAGIAHPEKFFGTLRKLGAEIVRAEALSDHQTLTPALMKRLESDAIGFRQKVVTLPVRLVFEQDASLRAALTALTPSRTSSTTITQEGAP